MTTLLFSLLSLLLAATINAIEMHGEAHVLEKSFIPAPMQCLHSMIYKGLCLTTSQSSHIQFIIIQMDSFFVQKAFMAVQH